MRVPTATQALLNFLCGVYHLHSVSVKQWQGVMSLSTTPQTIIEVSTRKIKPSKTSLAELVFSTIQLSVLSTHVQCSCPQCGKPANRDGGRLFKCLNCSTMALSNKLRNHFILKLAKSCSDRLPQTNR